MRLLDNFSQLPNKKRWWTSIAITCVVAAALTIIGIFGIGQYGIGLFILTPLFIGMSATMLYGYKHRISAKKSTEISMTALGFVGLALLVFAMEGLICILMAAPGILLLTWIGSVFGHVIISKKPSHTAMSLLALILFIPLTGFVEERTGSEENIIAVTSAVKINASRETVWKNVIVFPELEAPAELLFKAGIAYPINATIQGQGVGAVRYCNFTTGSFVEPITRWEEPALLSFDVRQSPQPMKELSFWDVDAPHLHDYFVSKKGRFKLIKISENETLLEGTTWYYNKIKPAFYWNLWSDYIIHQIHNRVLTHIKKVSEK